MFSATELAPVEDQSGIFLDHRIAAGCVARVHERLHERRDREDQGERPGPRIRVAGDQPHAAASAASSSSTSTTASSPSWRCCRTVAAHTRRRSRACACFRRCRSSLPSAGQSDVELVVRSTDSYENMAELCAATGASRAAQRSVPVRELGPHAELAAIPLVVRSRPHRRSWHGRELRELPARDAARGDGRESLQHERQGVSRDSAAWRPTLASTPEALLDLSMRSRDGDLIPLRTLVQLERVMSPSSLGTFNQQRAFRITGAVTPGTTSGQALTALEKRPRRAAAGELQPRLRRRCRASCARKATA